MPTYKYVCSVCSMKYLEHRDITHPQSITHCKTCNVEFVEVFE